jgi:hypothetical protein
MYPQGSSLPFLDGPSDHDYQKPKTFHRAVGYAEVEKQEYEK